MLVREVASLGVYRGPWDGSPGGCRGSGPREDPSGPWRVVDLGPKHPQDPEPTLTDAVLTLT